VIITRGELGRIVREEAARLQEAPRGGLGAAREREEARRQGAGRRRHGPKNAPRITPRSSLAQSKEADRLNGTSSRSSRSSEGGARTLEDVGSFEAAQGGDEMRNFADALEEHRDRLGGISGREVAALRKKIEAVMKTLRELAKEWDGLLLGPDDEH